LVDSYNVITTRDTVKQLHWLMGREEQSQPNAGAQPLLEAGARQERTVGSGGGVTIASSPKNGTGEFPRMPLTPIDRR
jgi:hypothetical protein